MLFVILYLFIGVLIDGDDFDGFFFFEELVFDDVSAVLFFDCKKKVRIEILM